MRASELFIFPISANSDLIFYLIHSIKHALSWLSSPPHLTSISPASQSLSSRPLLNSRSDQSSSLSLKNISKRPKKNSAMKDSPPITAKHTQYVRGV